jgi:methyl-accepting chemotaxis protein
MKVEFMKLKFSFKMKVQLILLTVSVTALVLLSLTAYQSSVAFRMGKEAQLSTSVDGLMDKIDRNLFERYGDVQAFAVSEAARSGDAERITAFMNDMMVTYAPIYDLMIVTDATGKVIAASTKGKSGQSLHSESLVGADFSTKPWFKEAISSRMKAGTSYVEDFHVDEDVARIAGTSGGVMNFSAPVRDKASGRILGVWSNRVSWSDVVEAIAKEEAEKMKSAQILASFPYLIDSKGTYLFQPEDQSTETKKVYPVRLLKLAANQNVPIRETEVTSSSFNGMVLEAVSRSKGYSSYPSRGWTAILQIPAYDQQSANNGQLVVLAFALVLIANIFAFIVIRKMSTSFERVVIEMTKESKEVRSAANRISTASQQLSESTTEQAAAIEETAASMEEITSMVGQTTQNAGHCKDLSEEGQLEALKGKQVIAKMSFAMDEIKASNSKLDRLVGVINDISNKTKIINDIVSETRLLSFNASIEAARAGVHGKGFAVVAEEVGKLASISGRAANEIRELLDSSGHEVTQVVKDTQERVAMGQSISQECEVAFSNMGQSLEKMNDLIATIAVAAKEQETGIKQTNRAISEMDKVTQSNSSGAELMAAEAESLHLGAESLNQSIDRISLIVLGEVEKAPSPTKKAVPSAQIFAIRDSDVSSESGGEATGGNPARSEVTRGDSRWKTKVS